MFCRNCGNSIPDGARFCSECGTPAEVPAPASGLTPAPGFGPAADLTPPTEPIPPAAAPIPTVIPISVTEDPYSPPPVTPPAAGGKKKRKGLLALLIGVAAIVVIAVIVLLIVLLGGKSSGGKNSGYVYLTEDGELMYLKNLKESTEAVELSDEGSSSSRIVFSEDGKYLYFTEPNSNSYYLSTLYRVQISKLGKDGRKAEKIASDVYSFSLLDGDDLAYVEQKNDDYRLYFYDGEADHKLASSENYFSLYSEQGYAYYRKYDANDDLYSLYRVTLNEEGEEERLIKDCSTIYSSYTDEIYLFGVEDGDDDLSLSTIYSVVPGESDTELLEDVYRVSSVTVEDGKLSFYYFTCQQQEYTLYDFVSDTTASEDTRILAAGYPDSPDYYDDYYPRYGLYTASDGRQYYETRSGLVYYLDPSAYPHLDDPVDIAYEMADDLYDAALDDYYTARDNYYAADDRAYIRERLQESAYTLTSYTLYRYEDGTSTQLASGLSSASLTGSSDLNAFFYEKSDNSSPTVLCDLSELEYASDIYDLMDQDTEGDTVYQNINGVESVLELDGDSLHVSSARVLNDKELILIISEDGEYSMQSYTIEKNAVVYSHTIVDEMFTSPVVHSGPSGDVLYYFVDQDEDAETGTLMCYFGGESTEIADDVVDIYALDDSSTVYLVGEYEYEYSGDYNIAELSVVNKDGQTEIDDELHVGRLRVLSEDEVLYISDDSLYYWNGKESRRISDDAVYLWVDELASYTYTYADLADWYIDTEY